MLSDKVSYRMKHREAQFISSLKLNWSNIRYFIKYFIGSTKSVDVERKQSKFKKEEVKKKISSW